MNIPENFDRWMFDYLEGNLTPAEANEFEQFLELNPSFQVDAEAWENAIVETEAIDYPNIHSLERKRKFAGTWQGWSAAASLVLLLVGGGYYLLTDLNLSNLTAREFIITNGLNGHEALGNDPNQPVINGSVSSNGTSLMSNSIASLGSTFSNGIRNGVANHGTEINHQSPNDGGINPTYSNDRSENDLNQPEDKLSTNINRDDKLKQELVKFESQAFSANYQNNPKESDATINVRKKNNTHFNSFGAVTKRIYRKLERMMGYPVDIVNTRDQALLMPENSLVSSNPGFTGAMLKPRFEMNYRNQWLGSGESVQRSQLSFDDYVESIRGGFGISLNSAVYNDGGFADHSVDIRYSPKIMISPKIVFEPAVKLSLGVLSASTEKLGLNQHVELNRGLLISSNFETTSSATNTLWYKDYGLGFVVNLDKFYVGASADNLNRHYANIFRVEGATEPVRSPILFNAIAGFDYVSKTRPFSLSPFIAARQFGELTEAWGGMTVRLNYFTFGASYSTQNNYAASIGLKFNKFKLTYQYDVTQSLYTQEKMGSHNLGIRFNGGDKKHITNRR